MTTAPTYMDSKVDERELSKENRVLLPFGPGEEMARRRAKETNHANHPQAQTPNPEVETLSKRVNLLEASRRVGPNPWLSFVLSVAIPLAALGTTWYEIHGQRKTLGVTIKGIEDGIAILALNQATPIREAVNKALYSKLTLPGAEIARAHREASLLVSVSPDSSETWQLVGAVVNYRSDADPLVNFRTAAGNSETCADGTPIKAQSLPITFMAYFSSLPGNSSIYKNCAQIIDLARFTAPGLRREWRL